MLVMGMGATARLIKLLQSVAQWRAAYGFFAPLANGLIAFSFGMIAHVLTRFVLVVL